MDTTTLKNNKQVRTPDKREKNYAPVDPRINALEKANTNKLYAERQRKRQEIKAHVTPTAAIGAIPMKMENTQRKRNNRIQAQLRIKNKCSVSPYMVLEKMAGMTVSQRMKAYNSKHKCTHGRHFNKFQTKECTKCGHDHLEFYCDHERETTTFTPTSKCPSCNHMRNVVLRDCDCRVEACSFCKLTTYTLLDQTEIWCLCHLPPIVDNTASMQEYMDKFILTKINKPKQTITWTPPAVVTPAAIVTPTETRQRLKGKIAWKKARSVKITPHRAPIPTGNEIEPEIEEGEILEPADEPQRDINLDFCRHGHILHKHLGCIDVADRFADYEFFQGYYREYRTEIIDYLKRVKLGEMMMFIQYVNFDDYFEGLKATATHVNNQRITALIRQHETTKELIEQTHENDWKLKIAATEPLFIFLKFDRDTIMIGTQRDNTKITHEYLPLTIEIMRHGTGFSAVKNVATNAGSTIKELVTTVGSKIKEFFKNIVNMFTSLKDKMRALIKDYVINKFLTILADAVTQHPFLVVSILSSLTALVTANGWKDIMLNTITLLGMITTMVKAATNTKHASLLDYVKAYFNKAHDEVIIETTFEELTQNTATEIPDMIYEAVTEMSKVIEEEEAEGYNPFDEEEKEVAITKHGAKASVVLSMVARLFGFSTRIIGIASKMGFEGLRNFNTLFQVKKNLGDILGALSEILPSWLKTLIKVGNPKAYIAEAVNDPQSVLGKAYHASLAYWMMIREGALLDLCLEQKHVAMRAYEDWIAYAKATGIVIEGDFSRINREIEKFMTVTAKPVAREREPFMIRLSGDSGVGKSTLWPVLLAALPEFEKFTDEKQFKDITYVRQVGADYWDGYTNEKKILLYDDFNHAREEIDLAEMICVGSTAAYMPAMASIDVNNTHVGVKGTQFTSPYVIMLTNNRMIAPTTLFSTEAINRRRTIHFHLTFKKEKGTNGSCRAARKADFSHINFELDYSTCGQEKLENLTLQEVRDLVYNEYMEFNRRQDAIHCSVTNLLKMKRDKVSRVKMFGTETKQVIVDQEPTDYSKLDLDFGNAEFFRKHGSNMALDIFRQSTYNFFMAAQAEAVRCFKKGCSDCRRCVLNSFYGIKTWLGNSYKNIVKVIIGMTTAIAAMKGIHTLYKMFKGSELEKHSGTTKTTKYPPPTRMIVKEGATTDILNLVRSNTVQLTQQDNPYNYQNGLFIQGTILATTEHFFHNLNEKIKGKYVPNGTIFEVRSPYTKELETFKFDESRLTLVKGADGGYLDCVLYEIPNVTIRSRRTILDHFWDGKTGLRNRAYASVHINTKEQLSAFRGKILEDNINSYYENGVGDERVMVQVHRTFAYDFRGIPGDCGTPILCDDDSFPQKIIGFHIGATGSESIGMIVTKQSLVKAMKNMSQLTREAYIEKNGYRLPEIEDVQKYDLPGKIGLYGVSNYTYMPPNKSTIVPSPLFGKITEPTTKPAKLNMFEALGHGKDIMKMGIGKYSHPSPAMDEDVMLDVTDAIIQEVNHIPTINRRKKLTVMEAVNGIAEEPGINKLNMSTSSGYPFSVFPEYIKYKGPKKLLFDLNEETGEYTPKDVLMTQIEECLEKMKRGIIPDMPFVDCLKDERRPMAKVDAYKTRVFSICPVAMTIITRMYMLPYTAHMMETRHKTHIAMGINKNSLEWQRMYNRMTELNPEACDGDATEWDGRMHKQVMRVHYDAAHEFFVDKDTEDRVVRDCLWIYHSEAIHIYYDPSTKTCALYICNGGNPSGQGDTTAVNTTGNLATFIYAWCKLAPPHLRDPLHFFENVRAVIYGDDSIYSCKEQIKEFYTPMNIQAVLEAHGMKYGPADKVGDFKGFKPFEECTFLKNSTTEFYGWKVPFMEDNAVFETINWIRQDKNSPPPEKCCEDNCNDVLRAVMFRGETEYNNLRNKIKEFKPEYNLLRFRYLKEQFLTNGALSDPYNTDGFTRSNKDTIARYDLTTLAQY